MRLKRKLKYYAITNSWLSGVQKGIQGAHALAEIMKDAQPGDMSTEWADLHKTMVFLNGGTSEALVNLYNHCKSLNADRDMVTLPVSIFYESEACLGGAATAVGLIAPDYFGNQNLTAREKSDMIYFDGLLSDWETVATQIASLRLAS